MLQKFRNFIPGYVFALKVLYDFEQLKVFTFSGIEQFFSVSLKLDFSDFQYTLLFHFITFDMNKTAHAILCTLCELQCLISEETLAV